MRINILLYLIFYNFLSYSQSTEIYTQSSSLNYLKIPKDALSSSLGGSASFLYPTFQNGQINPALTTLIENQNIISLSFIPWQWYSFIDKGKSYLIDLGYSHNIKGRHFLSTQLHFLNHGELQLRNSDFEEIGNNSGYDLGILINYGFKINPNFSIGIEGKLCNSKLLNNVSTISSIQNLSNIWIPLLSIGLNYEKEFKNKNKINIGLSALNLGPKISYNKNNYFFLPSKILLYFNYQLNINDENSFSFNFQSEKYLVPFVNSSTYSNSNISEDNIVSENINSIPLFKGWAKSFNVPNSKTPISYLNSFQNSLGIEYAYKKIFFTRLGLSHMGQSYGGLSKLHAGVGVSINAFSVHLSYETTLSNGVQNYNPTNNTLKISLFYNWRKIKTSIKIKCPPSNN